jgi:hypothetical protein
VAWILASNLAPPLPVEKGLLSCFPSVVICRNNPFHF